VGEYQVLELGTFVMALAAAVILLNAGMRLMRSLAAFSSESEAKRRWISPRWGGGLILFTGAASLFFAGEEVNWGQTFFHWGIAASKVLEVFGPTSVHNEDLSVSIQALGTLFLFCFFIGLPLLWTLRSRSALPLSLQPALPEGPCVAAFVVALLWETDPSRKNS
jgi:hypothetical protein